MFQTIPRWRGQAGTIQRLGTISTNEVVTDMVSVTFKGFNGTKVNETLPGEKVVTLI